MRTLLCAALAVTVAGCGKDEKPPKPAASASASASAPQVASSPVPSASVAAAPSASASAEPEAKHDCPAGSTGTGSFAKPCEAKGKERMMEAAWSKTDDKGLWFRVKSKSKLPILYGKVAVYFYDKAGKQIDVKQAVEGSDKTHAFHACTGNIFEGAVKAGEKIVLTFSCVKKSHVPEGAVTIEAEIPRVGFADASGKKNEFYWQNADLVPEERPKGGIK
jgi:hypothetical protein